jgi:hypothetical protein
VVAMEMDIKKLHDKLNPPDFYSARFKEHCKEQELNDLYFANEIHKGRTIDNRILN